MWLRHIKQTFFHSHSNMSGRTNPLCCGGTINNRPLYACCYSNGSHNGGLAGSLSVGLGTTLTSPQSTAP